MIGLTIFLCAISLAVGSPLCRRTLNDEFKELQAIIPHDKMDAISDYYLENDAEVRRIDDYLQSKDAIAALRAVMSVPEVYEFITWISENANKEDDYDFFKSSTNKIAATIQFSKNSGWNSYMNEVLEIFPYEEFQRLVKYKVTEGGIFAKFYYKAKEIGKLSTVVKNLPEVNKFLTNIEILGVDLDAIFSLVQNLFQ